MVALKDAEHVDNLLKLACYLNSAMEAELTAIHVVEIGPGLPLDIDAEIFDQAGKMILGRASEVAALNSVPMATSLVRAHHAGQAIVREASDQKICLLIMGSHPGHGLAEMLFGSTVQYVARHAPCRLVVEIFPPSVRHLNRRAERNEAETVTAD
jgi:nucleotide-binding universal stress UspA family protein